ncbi:MAG: cysteine desulfurase [Candidatus Bipolaricaulota bacterium]
MDVEKIRRDFPILGRKAAGKPFVYLDSAATSQKPSPVIDALGAFYRESNANVHRALYGLAAEATERYEAAREKVASLLGAIAEEIVFVRGTTEALNLAAHALGDARLKGGDTVVVTEMEHHANLVPWQQAARRHGARLEAVPITDGGELDIPAYEGLVSSGVKVMAVAHASNVLGTINPVPELADAARRAGALVVVDAAQTVPHMPVSVRELGADMVAFSGHKMLGPTGIGVLWARKDLLEELPPFMTGGEMIREVWLDRASWAAPPRRFEAGTPPFAQGVGLGAAVDYLAGLGLEEVRAHDVELVGMALEGLACRRHVTVYGPLDASARAGLVAFNLGGVHPHDVATLLDQEGIAIRAGHHCAQPLMRHLGVTATCRASFYLYNTTDEVDVFLQALDEAWSLLG